VNNECRCKNNYFFAESKYFFEKNEKNFFTKRPKTLKKMDVQHNDFNEELDFIG
jgi:hypothetical protein